MSAYSRIGLSFEVAAMMPDVITKPPRSSDKNRPG